MRVEGILLPALLALGTLPGRASSLAFSNLRAYSNNYLDSLQIATNPEQKGRQQQAQTQRAQQWQTLTQPQADLSDAARYLDAQGAAYVDSLAEGRRQRQAQSHPPATEGPPSGGSALPSRGSALPSRGSAAAPPPAKMDASAPPTWAVVPAQPPPPPPFPSADDDRRAAVESRLSAVKSELASLQAENRALKAAGGDLLRRIRDVAARLDEMEGCRMEMADLSDQWERSLQKSVEVMEAPLAQ